MDQNGNIKSWENIAQQYKISNKLHFKWRQLIHAIPSSWKKVLKNDNGNCKNILFLNNHLIKNNQIYAVEKLTAKELYSFSVFFKNTKPTSQEYFQSYFSNANLMWNDIYNLPWIVTIDSQLRYFQYKILHNVLYLNKNLFLFHKSTTKLCSFCNLEDETAVHLFANCNINTSLWNNIKEFFHSNLSIPPLTPQSAILGFYDIDQDAFLIINHILLLFKYFIYISRDTKTLSFSRFYRYLQTIYTIEKRISQESEKKKEII